MHIAIIGLALVAAACVLMAISVERDSHWRPTRPKQAGRVTVGLWSWPAQAGAAARRGLRSAVPLAVRAKAAVTRGVGRALDGGPSADEGPETTHQEPRRSAAGPARRLRFSEALEVTDVQTAVTPSMDGLFGDGYGPARPGYRTWTALRLVLALMATGVIVALVLLAIVIGIRTLVG